ncbi:MAG: nicotinate (nicotinamide) nucleotide adenylyltransferase [Rhodothermaceae bacterium]
MNKTGIFGGTFDPVHKGHILTAKKLVEIRKLDKLIFIPCNISPHKTDKSATAAVHRLEMLKLAVQNHPEFDFTDYEIQKGDISYTLNTLEHFSKIYNKIELVIGYDNLVSFHTWREPDKILELADLIVMKRNTDSAIKPLNKYFGKANFVETPVIDVSSTEIRARLKNNSPISDLVPPEVEKYIIENKLYL